MVLLALLFGGSSCQIIDGIGDITLTAPGTSSPGKDGGHPGAGAGDATVDYAVPSDDSGMMAVDAPSEVPDVAMGGNDAMVDGGVDGAICSGEEGSACEVEGGFCLPQSDQLECAQSGGIVITTSCTCSSNGGTVCCAFE
jgi:hypothetical protein